MADTFFSWLTKFYFKKQHYSCAVFGVKDYWRGG
ncbi:uncharacterized protein METZ01_LOCUS184043 [marine metagenome]|uniref:Uncharacterized protein n=1 Tax=marine metagenome TaxID=408172 RepID=A0A382CZ98_9ZZZZ